MAKILPGGGEWPMQQNRATFGFRTLAGIRSKPASFAWFCFDPQWGAEGSGGAIGPKAR